MISVVMPCREDEAECNATIKSLRETAGDIEIIVIDDGSRVPLKLDDSETILRRVHGRAGVDASRHIGAVLASNPYLLFLDAHMRCEAGWYERAVERIKGRDSTVHCATCLGLTPGNMDIRRPDAIYNGASLMFSGVDQKTGEHQFIAGKWNKHAVKDDEQIQCCMGAAYFVPRSFFFKIGGLKMLHSWGTSEEFLSMKTWLAGGEVRSLQTVRFGHQFRTATTYTSKRYALMFNKLVFAALLFPDHVLKHFMEEFELHTKERADLRIAKDWLAREQRHLEVEKVVYEAVFTRRFEDWFDHWKVPRFWP